MGGGSLLSPADFLEQQKMNNLSIVQTGKHLKDGGGKDSKDDTHT